MIALADFPAAPAAAARSARYFDLNEVRVAVAAGANRQAT
jgi:hypothetical protein